MNTRTIEAIFQEEVSRFSNFFYVSGIKLIIHNTQFSPGGKRQRDVAWANIEERTVNVVKRCVELAKEEITALIRHELGHLVDPFVEEPGREQRADDIAFLVSGERINYTSKNIQTTADGRYPRPRNLHR